jgi:hypothetical protein
MTRISRWALGVALLTAALISLLTTRALAEAAGSPAAAPRAEVCSEGCHEARPGPPPPWHTYHLGRTTGQAANPAAQVPTTLSLSPSSWALGAGEMVNLMAVVKDAQGAPVPGAVVHFYVDAEFAGKKGQVEVGAATANAQGVAFLDYQPTTADEKQRITARFDGVGNYAKSEQTVEIQQVEPPLPAYRPEPSGLEGVGRWTEAAFLAALAGVWVAFGYIAYQGYAIARGQ